MAFRLPDDVPGDGPVQLIEKVPVMTTWPGVGFPRVEQFPGIVLPWKLRLPPVTLPPTQPLMVAVPVTWDDWFVLLMPGLRVACPLTLLHVVNVVTARAGADIPTRPPTTSAPVKMAPASRFKMNPSLSGALETHEGRNANPQGTRRCRLNAT